MGRHQAKNIELTMVCAALYVGEKSEGAVSMPEDEKMGKWEDGFLRPVTT